MATIKKKTSVVKKVKKIGSKEGLTTKSNDPVLSTDTKLIFKPLSLPSDNSALEKYILNNKVNMMECVISSIEDAVNNNMHIAQVFIFDNNEFLITINPSQFKKNIEKIYNFYLQNEYYELCSRVSRLIKTINEKQKV